MPMRLLLTALISFASFNWSKNILSIYYYAQERGWFAG